MKDKQLEAELETWDVLSDESLILLDNLLNREEEPEDTVLVASGVLQQLVDRALQESPSPDWERELLDEIMEDYSGAWEELAKC